MAKIILKMIAATTLGWWMGRFVLRLLTGLGVGGLIVFILTTYFEPDAELVGKLIALLKYYILWFGNVIVGLFGWTLIFFFLALMFRVLLEIQVWFRKKGVVIFPIYPSDK